jgi:hypothetical protein
MGPLQGNTRGSGLNATLLSCAAGATAPQSQAKAKAAKAKAIQRRPPILFSPVTLRCAPCSAGRASKGEGPADGSSCTHRGSQRASGSRSSDNGFAVAQGRRNKTRSHCTRWFADPCTILPAAFTRRYSQIFLPRSLAYSTTTLSGLTNNSINVKCRLGTRPSALPQ